MTTLLTAQVTAYADQVRAHLADLGAEVVDDLTDGLEADLAEELADRAAGPGAGGDGAEVVLDLSRTFGSAAEYAAELRAAAGLAPAGSAARRRTVRDALRQSAASWREDGQRALVRVRAVPGGAWSVDTLVALRPVWWVARGWVWFVVVLALIRYLEGVSTATAAARVVPRSIGGSVLLVALFVGSVALGRAELAHDRWRRLGIAATAIAVLACPWTSSQARLAVDQAVVDGLRESVDPVAQAFDADSVWVDGVRATNLFVYDASGVLVPDAQVFDDRGRPVRLVPEVAVDGATGWTTTEFWLRQADQSWLYRATTDRDGVERWNVYPMAGRPSADVGLDADGSWQVSPTLTARVPGAPFVRATPVREATGVTAPNG